VAPGIVRAGALRAVVSPAVVEVHTLAALHLADHVRRVEVRTIAFGAVLDDEVPAADTPDLGGKPT